MTYSLHARLHRLDFFIGLYRWPTPDERAMVRAELREVLLQLLGVGLANG